MTKKQKMAAQIRGEVIGVAPADAAAVAVAAAEVEILKWECPACGSKALVKCTNYKGKTCAVHAARRRLAEGLPARKSSQPSAVVEAPQETAPRVYVQKDFLAPAVAGRELRGSAHVD